ncbi:sensor histidine kinase [Streptomyces sp. NPDC051940]|uniref:sensor histidine kinase n=1 Tax=Streptomyces sp. NPDC051940 TaxID=3155675 RepID=UPI00343D8F29
MSHPVPWVPPVLYGAVLAGGLYYAGIGPGLTARSAAFAALLAALVLGELRAAPPAGTRAAAAALAARTAAYAGVAALDVSGLSRVLFVLVPFLGYFAFGRRAACWLGAGSVLALAAVFTAAVDSWWTRAAYISDLLMFALGVVLATTMAAVAVRERQARDRIAELSAARERNRLAREIHDSLGHHLTAIGVQLETAEAFAPLDPDRSARAVADARWSAGQALQEVRSSVRALGSGGDAEPGAELAELVARLDGEARRVTLTVTGTGHRPPLVLYRAAQEALANACRHAHASRIAVHVSYDEQGARLRVADDGRGFGGAAEGFGLRGLRERVRAAGGTVDIATSASGTTLDVAVPW